MAHSTDRTEWHVLDFYSDEEGSSALTVFVEGTRFHIIADISKLAKDTEIGSEYHELLQNYQAAEKGEKPPHKLSSSGGSSDSGVDVREQRPDGEEDVDDNPEGTLQAWMVEPLATSFEQLTEQSPSTEHSTLQDWYYGSTRFCELAASDNGTELEALELESTSDLEQRMQKLLPNMILPKYITDKADVKWFSANDFEVLSTSDQPPGTPFHPARIQNRKTKEICFLKIVDNAQPGPVKREIDILSRIKQAKLYNEINVPVLEGLLAFDGAEQTPSGKKRIMGFIQTDIPDPTPLTMKLTTEIPQEKRDVWAKEADRIKEILHKHDIIWGDAKADNFMVDKDDKLWIIDFGGSYTEGWVDKELNETEEGDDMGTDKIVNALIDPVANTCDPDEEAVNDQDQKDTSAQHQRSQKKRKRAEAEEEDSEKADSSTTTVKSSRTEYQR